MDENSDEEDIEVKPNPEIFDKLIQDDILLAPDTNLDADFNFLLAFVPILLNNIEDPKARSHCEVSYRK